MPKVRVRVVRWKNGEFSSSDALASGVEFEGEIYMGSADRELRDRMAVGDRVTFEVISHGYIPEYPPG